MEEPVTVPAIAAPGKVAPLPQPWEEKVSRSSGETYYYNPQTNESTFERPGGLPQPWEERTSQSTGDRYYFNPQTGESTYDRPPPDAGGGDGGERASGGLPHPWEERRSRTTGETYYFNTETEESTYERPAAKPAAVPPDGSLPRPWEERVSRRSGGVYYYNPQTEQSTFERPTALPHPWEERVSRSSGHKYYFNPQTQESSYERPEAAMAATTTAGGGKTARALPQPWEERVSRSTGDTYYFNPQTEESTYERPEPETLQGSATLLSEDASLPLGWTRTRSRHTSLGTAEPHYTNLLTREATFERPRTPRRPERREGSQLHGGVHSRDEGTDEQEDVDVAELLRQQRAALTLQCGWRQLLARRRHARELDEAMSRSLFRRFADRSLRYNGRSEPGLRLARADELLRLSGVLGGSSEGEEGAEGALGFWRLAGLGRQEAMDFETFMSCLAHFQAEAAG